MYHSKISGLGYYVPENIVTNDDLSKIMNTNDEWIQERTGIKERRHIVRGEDSTTSMGVKAAEIAIQRANVPKEDIDFVIFATLSPDYYFPGPGVLVQRDLGLKTVGALDVRNQCSGFVYAISIADQYIKTGMYKNILVIGSESNLRVVWASSMVCNHTWESSIINIVEAWVLKSTTFLMKVIPITLEIKSLNSLSTNW
jgi:3-oxoacyl-[acyl-carrier-protein] synthase-3